MKCFDIILGGASCHCCYKLCLLLTGMTFVVDCFPSIVIRGLKVFSKKEPDGSLHNDDSTNPIFRGQLKYTELPKS